MVATSRGGERTSSASAAMTPPRARGISGSLPPPPRFRGRRGVRGPRARPRSKPWSSRSSGRPAAAPVAAPCRAARRRGGRAGRRGSRCRPSPRRAGPRSRRACPSPWRRRTEPRHHVACASPCPAGLEPGYPGLYLGGRSGSVSPGSQKAWNYYVPRWSEEWSQYGTPPTRFIHNMVVQAFGFWPSTDKNPSPAVAFGIWNWVKGAWTAGIGRWGNEGDINNFATTYTFDSGQTLDTKQAAVTLLSSDHHSMTAERQVYLGFATIALGDYDIPTFASITSPPWVKPMEVAPIGFQATDTGLGVAAMRVTMQSNPIHSWKTSEG